MSLQSYLDSQIKLICPILGISFGVLDNKSTWSIHFDDSCTEQQRLDAQAYLDSFIWNEATQEADRKLERDDRYINAPIYKKGYKDYLISNPDATFCDYMDSLEN